MNRSKLIGATALASVMSASAAYAEMSISGLFAGNMQDIDGGGLASSFYTNSIYVSYSDSMDNGMGVGVSMSLTAAGLVTDVNIDTGMGTIGLGTGQDSAVDGMDGSPACYSLNACGSALSGKDGGAGLYNDGDTVSGNSIAYSNSMGGVSFKVTRGMEVDSTAATAGTAQRNDGRQTDIVAVPAGSDAPEGYTRLMGADATEGHAAVMSYAASTSIMGATVKAGVSQIDYNGATADVDPSFVTVAYSIAGLNLGYAMYDSDNGMEETQMGVGTSAMGMNVGVTFASKDYTTDTDYMRVSLSKGMGAASFGLDYTETDVAGGDADDTNVWKFMYVVGF
jgi:hypothetical protein